MFPKRLFALRLFPSRLFPRRAAVVNTTLTEGQHPLYQLTWAGETDRFYLGANGPAAWTLSRADGESLDAPTSGSLTVIPVGGEGEGYALDLEGDASGYTLAALVTWTVSGSYRLRLVLVMPDDTIVVRETPIYVMG